MLHSILPIFTQPCAAQESSKSGYPHRRLIVVSRFSSVFGNLKTGWLKGRCKFLHTQLIRLSSTMNVVSLLHKTILLMPSRPSLGGSQVLRADIGPPNHPPPPPPPAPNQSHTHTTMHTPCSLPEERLEDLAPLEVLHYMTSKCLSRCR